MKTMSIFNRMFLFKKVKQEQANRKRKLLDRIRYDIALIHQEAARQPLTARQQ